jgi:hypothetical protein
MAFIKRNALRRGTPKTGDVELPDSAESGSGGAYLMCTPASAVNSVVPVGPVLTPSTSADADVHRRHRQGRASPSSASNLSRDPAGAFVVSYYLDISSWNGNIEHLLCYSEDFGLSASTTANFDLHRRSPSDGSSFVITFRAPTTCSAVYFSARAHRHLRSYSRVAVHQSCGPRSNRKGSDPMDHGIDTTATYKRRRARRPHHRPNRVASGSPTRLIWMEPTYDGHGPQCDRASTSTTAKSRP